MAGNGPLATQYANGTIKLTTRQAFQFHGIIKSNLKRTIKEINQGAMDTIAACGDVNRNVMCNPNPYLSRSPRRGAQGTGPGISDHLTPRPAPTTRSGSTARR
jgi:sulfite reductase (NADPH) hemoprotein beta-component